MEEIEKEKALDNYPTPVTIEGTINILNQLQSCICKIENKLGNWTGLFCYIPYKNKKLTVLITNNHVINEEILKENKKIEVSINDNKEYKTIELKNKKVYTSVKYDTTIIEINSEKEKINHFLELDEEIIEHNENINNRSVYILQYPKYSNGQKAAVSYGIIKNIQDEYNIIHYCSTQGGSSGSPIINLINNKILGIHKESIKNKNYNRGTLLNFPINEYLNKYYKNTKNVNEINITINVEENEVNENIYFLMKGFLGLEDEENNEDGDSNENIEDKNYYDTMKYYNKLLNESKIEIFINNEKYENKKYFNPKEVGLYQINLKFNSNITNMSYMFLGCSEMMSIDLSSFDSREVTTMDGMFSECTGLKI